MGWSEMEQLLRARYHLPADWYMYAARCMPMEYGRPTLYYELKGAVAPLLTRGKRKGRPNWRKMDKATERTCSVTPAEYDAWVASKQGVG